MLYIIMYDDPAKIKAVNIGRYNWFDSYVKKMADKHPGISKGYEDEDNTWRIFSKQGTLLIKVNFDLENEYIVYGYLTDAGGKMSLISERTKDLGDLRLILPKLEAIDAFNK